MLAYFTHLPIIFTQATNSANANDMQAARNNNSYSIGLSIAGIISAFVGFILIVIIAVVA